MKLAVIGLDGASPNIYQQFLDSGELPNIKAIVDKGFHTDLQSCPPPITGPAWTTIQTGLKPTVHRNFGNVVTTPTYELKSRETTTANYLTWYDEPESVVVNMPASYPRDTENKTILVHAFDSPSKQKAIPKSIQGTKEYKNYYHGTPLNEISGGIEVALERMRDIESRRYEFAQRTFSDKDPELGFLLFSSTDWILHYFSQINANLEQKEKLLPLYKDIDQYIGEIRKQTSNILLLSDHGFQRYKLTVNLPKYLNEAGKLSFDNPVDTVTDNNSSKNVIDLIAHQLSRFERVRNHLFPKLKQFLPNYLLPSTNTQINHSTTEAFPTEQLIPNIYINDQRFNSGIVYPEERNNVLKHWKDYLLDTTIEHNEKKYELVKDIYAPKAKDNTSIKVPDLIPIQNSDVNLEGTVSKAVPIVRKGGWNHRRRGMLMGAGPAFDSQVPEPANFIDIAPTIYTALDRPVPNRLNGTSICSASEFRKPINIKRSPKNTSSENNSRVEENLKNLGYL